MLWNLRLESKGFHKLGERMKPLGKSVFIAISFACLLVFFVGYFGISSTYGDIVTDVINGVHLVPGGFGFENELTIYTKLDSESEAQVDYAAIKEICERRLALSSVVEYEVFPDALNGGLIIKIPFDSNVRAGINNLGRILVTDGLFELREGNEQDESGNPAGITENVVLDNSHIKTVTPTAYNGSDGVIYYLEFILTSEGKRILHSKAESMISEAGDDETLYLSAWVDGKLQDYYSASQMLEAAKLTSFSNSSSGYSLEEVTAMAISVSSGRLGIPLRVYKMILDHESGFSGENSRALVFAAFSAALLLSGAALVFRYRFIGVCGFISLLGGLGLMFFVLTSFYSNPAAMQITTATLGAFIVLWFLGVMIIIRDGESVKESLAQGLGVGKALGAGFGKTLSASLITYSSVFIAGLLVSDLFKRHGGLSSNVIKWVFPSFFINKNYVLGPFGTLLCVGAVFCMATVILMNRLMVKSLLSYSFTSKTSSFGGSANEKN